MLSYHRCISHDKAVAIRSIPVVLELHLTVKPSCGMMCCCLPAFGCTSGPFAFAQHVEFPWPGLACAQAVRHVLKSRI